jgi:hypothetical protein
MGFLLAQATDIVGDSLAPQALENDADLLLGREPPLGLAPDLLDDLLGGRSLAHELLRLWLRKCLLSQLPKWPKPL